MFQQMKTFQRTNVSNGLSDLELEHVFLSSSLALTWDPQLVHNGRSTPLIIKKIKRMIWYGDNKTKGGSRFGIVKEDLLGVETWWSEAGQATASTPPKWRSKEMCLLRTKQRGQWDRWGLCRWRAGNNGEQRWEEQKSLDRWEFWDVSRCEVSGGWDEEKEGEGG